MEAGHPPQLRRFPSVLDLGKLVAVEYDGEAGLFHQRLILRTSSTAAMLDTTGMMCDSSRGCVGFSHPTATCIPSSSEAASNGVSVAQRQERSHSDDDGACWSASGCGERVYEFGAVIVRSVLEAHETEDTRDSRVA